MTPPKACTVIKISILSSCTDWKETQEHFNDTIRWGSLFIYLLIYSILFRLLFELELHELCLLDPLTGQVPKWELETA